MLLALLGVLLSMLIIWRSCDAFENATSYLGRNLTDGVRGATFNAIGSSLPELLTTFSALIFYVNKEGFAFGIATTAGSAIFNSAVIPSLVILTVYFAKIASSIKVSKKVILRDGVSLLLCELTLIYILTFDKLTWVHGFAMLMLYVSYLCVLFSTMNKSDTKFIVLQGGLEHDHYDDDPENGKNRILSLTTLNLRNFLIGNSRLNTSKSWLLLFTSMFFIGGACHLLVESCYLFGTAANINTYFVAVILAAAATSVPDTIISIKDAKNGEYDDAVSNALGSNIFDICVCLGLPLMVYCLFTGETISIASHNSGHVAELRVLLLFLTGVVLSLLLTSFSLSVSEGVIMLSLYGLFVWFIFGRATNNETMNTVGDMMQSFLNFIGG